ncbi:hypothetical protein XENOCAPTIV_005051, partial [Xenoophorus captivus]
SNAFQKQLLSMQDGFSACQQSLMPSWPEELFTLSIFSQENWEHFQAVDSIITPHFSSCPRRHISAIRQGFRVWWRKEEGSGYAVYLTHDLSMLRLIETFCESTPQLILMIYVMLRTNKARTVQCESHFSLKLLPAQADNRTQQIPQR